jgi:hypothetical protein
MIGKRSTNRVKEIWPASITKRFVLKDSFLKTERGKVRGTIRAPDEWA